MKNKTTPPKFSNTLINEPLQTNPAPHINELGPLSHLVGTWTNKDFGTPLAGGIENPYSYNIMPLPTQSVKEGYILKNFKYYEEITFSPINGAAPNRGGDYTQTANVLFYEQRIYFADGPGKGQLVHAENGSWLFLTTGPQSEEPYNSSPIVPHTGAIPKQSLKGNIAKQISVPHGNSILALGGFKGYQHSHPNSAIINGPLKIGDYIDAIPKGIDSTPYKIKGHGNPFPELNNNPNIPLQQGVSKSPCNEYIQWGVNTKNPEAIGSVTNIPFEKEKANVVSYDANYWLQKTGTNSKFTQLSYNQTIWMDIHIDGKLINFPHITCNTLTKKE